MLNRVLGIVYTHEHRALLGATEAYCRALNHAGFNAQVIDLADAGGAQILREHLSSGEVAFGFGIQGVGSRLKSGADNLWTKFRIPFLGLHFDNPCYNRCNHYNLSPFVANLYHFESFLEIQKRYIGGNQVTGLLPFEVPEIPPEPQLAFSQRPIKLMYLKAGGPVKEYVNYFNGLPPSLRDGVWQQLERTKNDPNLLICDLVQELFGQLGYSRVGYEEQFWAIVQSMDYYVRRQRAIDFVNWLKFQDGAMIIGDGWDMIDRTGARAEFLPSMNFDEAYHFYEQTQFICNTNPYGRDIIHERIVLGLILGCCVLTDGNGWWDQHFSNLPALTRFRWNETLDDQLQPVINDLHQAGEASTTGRMPILQKFVGNKSIPSMVAYAKQIKKIAT